jgi:uncharacterized membrane protein
MAKNILLWAVTIIVAANLFWSICFIHYDIMNPLSRDYRLTGSDISIGISEQGITDVKESISYQFKGCFREVFRGINIPKTAFNAPYISKITASCQPKCEVFDRGYEIAGNFGSICDQSAKFFVDFTVKNGITLGSDIAEFHYKVWGDKWEKPLNALTSEITLPFGATADNTLVYFNPIGIVKEQHFEGNVLSFKTEKFEGYLEVRLLMPKEIFAQGQNFAVYPGLTKNMLVKEQSDYAFRYNLITYSMILLYAAIIISFAAVPYFLFKKYGKEPRISYRAIFEREPVRGIKPYMINALCNAKTGHIDNNAIIATLLDLVRRKHIDMEETKKKTFFGMKQDVVLTFRNNPKDELNDVERRIYGYLSGYSTNGKLAWSDFLGDLKPTSEALKYQKMSGELEKTVYDEFQERVYFGQKGNILFKIICGLMILLAIALWELSTWSSNYPIFSFLPMILPLMIALPIIGLLLPRRVFGRFTPEGLEIYQKSANYKKFMTDMTLLKKYPPASIIIWEEHLVYATAFGVAANVIKQMKLVVKDAEISSSRLYPAYNIQTIHSLGSVSTVASSHSSSGGGFGGGAGGGFGGGGGGAR